MKREGRRTGYGLQKGRLRFRFCVSMYLPGICIRGTWGGRRGCRRRGAASWPAGAPRCGCDSGTRPEKQQVRDFLFTEKGINGDTVRRGAEAGRLRPGANLN